MYPAVVDGTLAGFRVRRCGEGPRMAVLVHGAMLSAASWEAFQQVLHRDAPDWTTIAVDLPGFGQAPAEPWETYREMASRLAGLLSHLRAAYEKLVVVGHSMGGGIALTMLRHDGELPDGAIIMDSGPGQSQGEVSIGSIVGNLDGRPGAEAICRIVRSWFPAPDEVELDPLIRDAGRVSADTFARMLAAIRGHDLSTEVSRFPAVPVLLLRGSQDRTRTACEMQALLNLPGRTAYVEISGAGHCPQIENATETAFQVARWLEKI